jgi:hypothetical protein
MFVPALDRRFQVVNDLLGGRRMLAIQGAVLDDPLNGFGHIQPGTAQRRIEQADPLLEAPLHQVRRLVTRQIIPDQQHTQWRQVGWQHRRHR